MRPYLIIMCLLTILISCDNKQQSYRLRNSIIDKCSKQADCKINMTELTWFEWDKLFVFDESATYPLIKRELGFEFPKYKEFSRFIIFTLDDEIVYFEEEPYNPSQRKNNSVWFSLPIRESFMYFDKQSAIFEVEINIIDEKTYYTLHPIKQTVNFTYKPK